jgi:hypothetical protein
MPVVQAAQGDGGGDEVRPQCRSDRSAQPAVVEVESPTGQQPVCEGICRVEEPAPVLGTASQVAFVDPSTGELVSGPEAEARGLVLGPELSEAVRDSSEGLVQERSPVEGGGWSVDLKGRFRHVMVATVAADGSITYSHEVAPVAAPAGQATSAEGQEVGQAEADRTGAGGVR